MPTADKWLSDLPRQFQGKKNIEILINAFAKQLDELIEVYETLNTKTDIDTATGDTLDMVGSIVNLSRKAACELMLYGDETTITDESYRQALRFMKYQNLGDGTYDSLMEAVEGLFPDYHVRYTEDPDSPASFRLDVEAPRLEDTSLFRTIPIKPAGVGAKLYFDKDSSGNAYIGMAYKSTKVVTPTDKEAVDPMDGVTLFTYGDDLLVDSYRNPLKDAKET